MNWQEIIVFGIVLLAGVSAMRTFLQQFDARSAAEPACTMCPGCTLVQPRRSRLLAPAPQPLLAKMVKQASKQAVQKQ